jgi:hypothetical protein
VIGSAERRALLESIDLQLAELARRRRNETA